MIIEVEIPKDKIEFFLELMEELKCVKSFKLIGGGSDKKIENKTNNDQ